MTFIDNVACALFVIGFSGLLLLYSTVSVYRAARRGKKNPRECLKAACVPLAVLGTFMLVTGLWGQFSWPLPGSYNILFYDPLVLFGVLLVSFCLTVRADLKLEYVGFLGLMLGAMAILYGVAGYNAGLTEAPLALLGMYALYGSAGILSYPVALAVDRFPALQRSRWAALAVALFWLALLGASLLAVYIGYVAVPSHLLSPP